MKTKYWIIGFALLAVVCLLCAIPLLQNEPASAARIYSDGELVKTVSLGVDQEFSVHGHNTITVKDGTIAVTQADCPDGYCMKRGFCSGGADIVCLPNRLVIQFTDDLGVDGVVG